MDTAPSWWREGRRREGGEEERKGERTGRDKFAVLVFKNV